MGTGGCVAMSDCQKALRASSFLLFITSINEVSFSALNLRRTMRRRSWYPQQIAALQHLESVPEIWWPTFSEEPPPSHHLSAGQVGSNAWPEISGRAASNGIWSTLNATHRLLSQISQLFFLLPSSWEKTLERNVAARFLPFSLTVIKRITGPRSSWAKWP